MADIVFLKPAISLAASLRKHLAADAYVELVTRDDEGTAYAGFLLAVSDNFVTMHLIDDWSVDGIGIFPIGGIAEVNRGELIQDRQAILDWKGVDRSDRFEWLDLSGYAALFRSAQARDVTLVLVDDDETEVGTVQAVGAAAVTLRLIDGAGDWLAEPLDYPYPDIRVIYVGDRYSTVLRAFADRETVEV